MCLCVGVSWGGSVLCSKTLKTCNVHHACITLELSLSLWIVVRFRPCKTMLRFCSVCRVVCWLFGYTQVKMHLFSQLGPSTFIKLSLAWKCYYALFWYDASLWLTTKNNAFNNDDGREVILHLKRPRKCECVCPSLSRQTTAKVFGPKIMENNENGVDLGTQRMDENGELCSFLSSPSFVIE